MKPKTLILMLVAVACGLVAAFLATNMGPSAAEQKVLVLVAARDLPAGHVFKEAPPKDLVLKGYAPDSLPPGTSQNFEDFRNKVLARSVDANTLVTSKDLSMAESLFKPCPAGYRAISIRVDLENATSGFTLPGSFVDLLCTLPDPTDARRTLTKTFMQNVLVLAVNTQREQPKEGGGVMANPGMLTVAVKPEDVERLIAAGARGTVKMALRRPGEKEVVETKGVTNPFQESDSSKTEGGGDKSQTVKVWVAEKSLLPGTEIDKTSAETLFKLVPYPQALARNALTEKDDLKGRLAHLVPEGSPITRAHYQVLGANDTAIKSSVSVLRIQEGAKVPVDYVFENGRSVTGGSGRESLPEPDSRPAPKGKGSEGPSEN